MHTVAENASTNIRQSGHSEWAIQNNESGGFESKMLTQTIYSQTSVFEHNSFWKAVRKPICSKAESYFPITNNEKEINLFYTPKE